MFQIRERPKHFSFSKTNIDVIKVETEDDYKIYYKEEDINEILEVLKYKVDRVILDTSKKKVLYLQKLNNKDRVLEQTTVFYK